MALGLTILLAPATALAIEVECMGPFGTCTVSNDGFDSIECSCDNGGFGTSGGMMYAGLDEGELMAVCMELVADCMEGFGTSGSSFIVGTDDVTSVGVTTGISDTEGFTTDVTGSESESATTSPVTSETASTTDHSTSDPSTTSGPDLTGSSTGDDPSTGGSSTSDGTSTGDGTTGNASLSTTGETNPPDDGSESSGGADTDTGGCGCTTDSDASPFAALGLFALLGLRRRRR